MSSKCGACSRNSRRAFRFEMKVRRRTTTGSTVRRAKLGRVNRDQALQYRDPTTPPNWCKMSTSTCRDGRWGGGIGSVLQTVPKVIDASTRGRRGKVSAVGLPRDWQRRGATGIIPLDPNLDVGTLLHGVVNKHQLAKGCKTRRTAYLQRQTKAQKGQTRKGTVPFPSHLLSALSVSRVVCLA